MQKLKFFLNVDLGIVKIQLHAVKEVQKAMVFISIKKKAHKPTKALQFGFSICRTLLSHRTQNNRGELASQYSVNYQPHYNAWLIKSNFFYFIFYFFEGIIPLKVNHFMSTLMVWEFLILPFFISWKPKHKQFRFQNKAVTLLSATQTICYLQCKNLQQSALVVFNGLFFQCPPCVTYLP